MTEPPMPEADKAAYHHGGLRQALLAAALAVIAEKGEVAFTMRELAGRIGVSHAAAYRHFPSKAALLGAIALQGFSGLSQALSDATAGTGDDVVAGFNRQGRAYVDFACAHPEVFRVMFHPEVCRDDVTGLAVASSGVFGALVAQLERGRAAGHFTDRPTLELAAAAWAMVHGLASLVIDGKLPGPMAEAQPPVAADALIEAVLATLATGVIRRT